MAIYNFNPDVCLQVLHGIAEEIPSGIRRKHIMAVYPRIKFSQELLNYIGTAITTNARSAIDWMWVRYRIPEKLVYLRQLEEKSPKTDAWRPITGHANVNSIIAANLLERKKELKKQIELLQEESHMIVPYIKAFSEQSREQLDEMDAVTKQYTF